MSLIDRWSGKLRRHRTRLSKFGVIGILGLIADVGGFNLLRILGEGPLLAKVISTGLGIIVAWLGNRYWTFSEKRRTGIHRELLLFIGVCLVGLAISLGCLAFSIYVLDQRSALAENISANVVGLGLSTMWRYWAMHRHVFNEKRPGVPAKRPATKVLSKVAD
jgi:putative flippase GtrA